MNLRLDLETPSIMLNSENDEDTDVLTLLEEHLSKHNEKIIGSCVSFGAKVRALEIFIRPT
jgi:hypothetical protein